MANIPVSILGATGLVGQRFVHMLSEHPWFEIQALAASESSEGKTYAEACAWKLEEPMPPRIDQMRVKSLDEELPQGVVFSALPSRVARHIEPRLASDGQVVCSNASAFRLEKDVPLLIPEVNADHLDLIMRQQEGRNWPGFIVASPNCTTTAIALPLKALDRAFGLRQAVVVSLQAISGAGHPGISMLDMMGNVLPYIGGEEEKMEVETQKLLGSVQGGDLQPAAAVISAHANRVPVLDGHLVCLSLGFERKPTADQAAEVMASFTASASYETLPSAPDSPLVVRQETDRPQPRLDRAVNEGMSVVVGRLRDCPSLDLRMVSLVHNTIRGAAGGAILNAELLYRKGYLKG